MNVEKNNLNIVTSRAKLILLLINSVICTIQISHSRKKIQIKTFDFGSNLIIPGHISIIRKTF